MPSTFNSTPESIGNEVLLPFLLNPNVIDVNKAFFDPVSNCFYDLFQIYSCLPVHALFSRLIFRFVRELSVSFSKILYV